MPEVYCGAKKVPKGKKRGTETQCRNMKQVRYYGVKGMKVDAETINQAIYALMTVRMNLLGRISFAKKEAFRYQNNPETKKRWEKEEKKAKKEADKVSKQITELKNKLK